MIFDCGPISSEVAALLGLEALTNQMTTAPQWHGRSET